MRKLVLIASAFFCLSFPILSQPCAEVITIPQLAVGGGYDSILTIHNQSSGEWTGTARLRRGNNELWNTPWSLDNAPQLPASEFEIALSGKQTRKFVISGDAQPRGGYLEIASENADVEDLVVSFFYNLQNDAGLLIDSVGSSIGPAATDFVFTAETAGRVGTGFAYAPFCVNEGFNVKLTILDQDGQQVGNPVIDPFEGHRAEFVNETFAQVPEAGAVRITSEEAIFLTVLRLETVPGGGLQLTGTPPRQVLDLVSTAYAAGETIPAEFACTGVDRSPPLTWSRPPEGTQSFALVLDDPDAPGGNFVHWILFNIPGSIRMLGSDEVPAGALHGRNDFAETSYGGPCPPPGTIHRYIFRLYALDQLLNLEEGASRQAVLAAMQGHILGTAQLVGTFPAP